MGELMNCGVLRACGRPREWMSLLCFDEMIMKSNKANGFTSRGELVCWIVFFFLARRAWARLFSLRLLVACLWVGYGWGPGPKATSPKRRQAQPVNQRNEKKTAIEVKWTNQINLSGSLFLLWNEWNEMKQMKRESELIWICEWSPTQAPKSARQAEMESNQTHFIVCVWWMEWKGWVGSSLGG